MKNEKGGGGQPRAGGSLSRRAYGTQRWEARPLRETVSMATVAGRPSGCFWGKARGGRRADSSCGDTRGSRKSVPRLASSSDTVTPSRFLHLGSGLGRPSRWAPSRDRASPGADSASAGQVPISCSLADRGAQNHVIPSQKAQRHPTR